MKTQMISPLVTVAIITYNSGGFIIDALESVKAQTYKNIELVISDDCSRDTTVALCQAWLAENTKYFKRTELIISKENTGISGNLNRAIEASEGEWIKFLGGDDLLLSHCIESNVRLLDESSGTSLIFSKVAIVGAEINKVIEVFPERDIESDGSSQLKRIIRENPIPAPGTFIRRSLLIELGGFDLRYPMIEDFPFWIKANLAGYYFIENKEVLVKYRSHANSLTNNPQSNSNPTFEANARAIERDILFPLLKKKGMYRELFYKKVLRWMKELQSKEDKYHIPISLPARMLLKVAWILR